jgi:CheY-like chemotaxis protein
MPKILVIDDDQDLLIALQIALEAHGFDVQTATTSRQGIAKILSAEPDLLILDVIMETGKPPSQGVADHHAQRDPYRQRGPLPLRPRRGVLASRHLPGQANQTRRTREDNQRGIGRIARRAKTSSLACIWKQSQGTRLVSRPSLRLLVVGDVGWFFPLRSWAEPRRDLAAAGSACASRQY